jgi:toxin ParE1/3/4
MSTPRSINLSSRARKEFVRIQRYTRQEWGIEQRDVYTRALLSAMNRIAEFPEIGASADDIRPGVRVFPVEEHVIYYRTTPKTLKILRIRHVRTAPLVSDDL